MKVFIHAIENKLYRTIIIHKVVIDKEELRKFVGVGCGGCVCGGGEGGRNILERAYTLVWLQGDMRSLVSSSKLI